MKKMNLLLLVLFILVIKILNAQSFKLAVNLDGIDDFATVIHDESLNPGDGSWAMLCWLKADNKDQNTVIVMKRTPEPPYTQYSFAIGKDDPHDPEPGKRIRINYIESAGEKERSGYMEDEFVDGNWHHIAVVANKEWDAIFVYVDGEVRDFIDLYYYGNWPDINVIEDLFIGNSSSGGKLTGVLDELSLWNKSLNYNDVQTYMYDTIPPEVYNNSESGLVAYYRFEQFENLGVLDGGVDDIRDLSVNANHADTDGEPVLVPSISLTYIEEHQNDKLLSVHSNPFQNNLIAKYNLEHAGDVKISLLDISGKVVYFKSIYHIIPGEHEFGINTNSLKPGVYVLRYENKYGSQNIKVVKIS